MLPKVCDKKILPKNVTDQTGPPKVAFKRRTLSIRILLD